jgi:hypothetical protein
MSSTPKSSAVSGLCYGIVVGGHDADAPSDYSGNLRVYFPGIHGKDVNVKHLAFSPRLMSPTGGTQHQFPGGLDPGTLVVAMKDTGSNQCQIIGMANDINNNDQTIAGNMSLLQGIAQYLTTNIQVRPPPTTRDATVNGARIRQIQEKGQLWNHGMTRGLPTHAATYNLAGMRIPQVSSVSTALQSFDNLITDSMIGNLPGVALSLGSLVSTILNTVSIMKQLNGKMSGPNMLAFQSMSYLLQSVEQTEGAGFMTGTRVNQDVYQQNAINLIGQATGISDMVNVFQRLQYDTSLFGLDTLAPVVSAIASPHGTTYRSFSPSGQMVNYTPVAVAVAAKVVTSFLSGAGFPGVIPGQNMFGGSSSVMQDMSNRLGTTSASLGMLQAIARDPVGVLINEGLRAVNQGGNPLQRMFPGI